MPRVVPFQISLQEAQEAFEAWHQSHWLAPGRLLRKGLGSMHAALLPFWIFETTVQVEYSGGNPIRLHCNYKLLILSQCNGSHETARRAFRKQVHSRSLHVSSVKRSRNSNMCLCRLGGLPSG